MIRGRSPQFLTLADAPNVIRLPRPELAAQVLHGSVPLPLPPCAYTEELDLRRRVLGAQVADGHAGARQ